MPFGLCNAPATFQRLMNQLLAGLQNKALAYLDDIIIFSRTFKDHLQSVAEVPQRLKNAGLKLKGTKCHFGVQQVHYLGFSVDSGGILPDKSKVRAIMDSPAPSNLTQLRSSLGLVGFYRRFIKDFSNKAEPLIALTRKGAAFFWSSTCDASFHALKNALSSATMLQYPDFNK